MQAFAGLQLFKLNAEIDAWARRGFDALIAP